MTNKTFYGALGVLVIVFIGICVYWIVDENEQQNGNVETLTVENYLEGLGKIDILDTITIPTDAALANYSSDDTFQLIAQFHKADLKLHALTTKYGKQSEALGEAQKTVLTDLRTGNIDRKTGWA